MNTRIKQLGLTALLGLTAMSAAAEVTVENAYVRAIPQIGRASCRERV